jgi:hypothetical protein
VSLLAELARIRQEAATVRARIDATDARRRAVAASEDAEAAYESYMEAVGTAEVEPSDEEEQRLTASLALARAGASPRAWQGRLRGAEHAAQEADASVDQWIFEHAHELADELVELASPLSEQVVAHYRPQLALEDEIAEADPALVRPRRAARPQAARVADLAVPRVERRGSRQARSRGRHRPAPGAGAVAARRRRGGAARR